MNEYIKRIYKMLQRMDEQDEHFIRQIYTIMKQYEERKEANIHE